MYTRATRVASSDGMVGYALDALRETCFGPFSDRLILLDYETFVRALEEAIGALYKLLGVAPFQHDFENVSYSADAFDVALGSPGVGLADLATRLSMPAASRSP